MINEKINCLKVIDRNRRDSTIEKQSLYKDFTILAESPST